MSAAFFSADLRRGPPTLPRGREQGRRRRPASRPSAEGRGGRGDRHRYGAARSGRRDQAVHRELGHAWPGRLLRLGLPARAARTTSCATRAADRGIALLLIHAVNPFGFSHLKRTNEDNIDLNRNFNDFATPYPDNPVYEQVHDLLVPKAWPPSRRERGAARGRDGAPRRPARPRRVERPGQASRRTLLLRHRAGLEQRHDTLDPAHARHEAAAHRLDRRPYRPRPLRPWREDLRPPFRRDHGARQGLVGQRPDRQHGGANRCRRAPIGHITGCAPEECPGAAITPTTLEYGTVPNPVVRHALRGEAWLAGHPDAPDGPGPGQSGARCATPSTSMPTTGRA